MLDDAGGRPFPDGEEPDERHHGGQDDAFASVVLDEDFVRGAEIHEPSAAERVAAAARLPDATEADDAGWAPGWETDEYDPDHPDHDPEQVYGPHGGPLRPYRGNPGWQRPVAWVLAVVMGLGIIALAFAAVYRGGTAQRPEPAPPTTTNGVGAPDERRPAPAPGGARPPSADEPGQSEPDQSEPDQSEPDQGGPGQGGPGLGLASPASAVALPR